MESEEINSFKSKFNDPNNFDVNDCIEYIKKHTDILGDISKYLFVLRISSYSFYSIIDKITEEIFRSFSSHIDVFLDPFFNLPFEEVEKNSYRTDDFIQKIRKYLMENKYSIDQIVEIFKKIVHAPFPIVSILFVMNFPEIQGELRKAYPEFTQSFDDKFSHINACIESWKKNIYIPEVGRFDTSNPRVSKFGGTAPYLPGDGPMVCKCGNDKLQTVFSLYVPNLPDEIKGKFPPDHEYVLVGYTCNSCYEQLPIRLFTDAEIDQLVYDDTPSNMDVFNEARTVTVWSKNKMAPVGLTDSGFRLPNKDDFSNEELLLIEQILTSDKNKVASTYLGGYPIFIQGDDSPEDHSLLLEMEESEASTNMWGDCGTSQVWMTTGDDFGHFVMQYACS